MAILAKADITISRIVDVKSVTTYYLLQSSTAASQTSRQPSRPVEIGIQQNQHTSQDQQAPIHCNLDYNVQ